MTINRKASVAHYCHKSPRSTRLRLALGAATAVLGLGGILVPMAAQAQICTPYLASLPKDQRLFLYFPTSDDATFPTASLGNISGVTSQPVEAFSAATLDSDLTATTAQLRDRIIEQVTDSYCEFSVEVIGQTAEPNPSGDDWQVIAIGADTSTSAGGGIRFGRAQDVDTGNSDSQDYARVWARGFHDAYGGAGDILSSTNASLERWAAAIAGTTAHEGAHNYGVDHLFANPRPGEDSAANHLIATGTVGTNNIGRVSRRHFSDTSFETMAYNIGLNTKTLSNWDFVNPNATTATGLRMRLLTTESSLNLTRVYTGTLSPWRDPSLTANGTETFGGTTYNAFDLTFTTGQSWANGSSGQVPAGEVFHVGAGVDAEVIVYDVVLTDGSGDMGLHPRMAGYVLDIVEDSDDTAGGAATGDAVIRFVENNDDVLVENVEVRFLPRPVALGEMVPGGRLVSQEGLDVQPFARLAAEEQRPIADTTRRGGGLALTIADMGGKRHLDRTLRADPDICGPNGETVFRQPLLRGPDDSTEAGGEDYCNSGTYLSLFPATSVYVTATIVDPDATYFDKDAGAMVTGPLRSRLYAQFAGVIPDLNENGIDDLRDIREGRSRDENGNGVPDEAERSSRSGSSGDWSVYAAAGVNFPDGSLDSGFSGTLGVDRHLTGGWSVGARAGLHQFEAPSGIPDDPEAVEVSLRVDKTLWTNGSARVFAGAGVGAYFLDPGDTEFGAHLGLGGAVRVLPRVDLELRGDYHRLPDPSFDFGTVQGGIRFWF